MKLHLAIDQGNSTSKIYIFQGESMIGSRRYEQLSVKCLEELFAEYSFEDAILSSVQNEDVELNRWIASHVQRFVNLTNTTPSPMKIRYDNPLLLGHDRIAAAVGAISQSEGCNLLVIDAGTAVTLDVVSAEGEFLGGNISPGLSTRFNSLHSYTSKLPLVEPEGEVPLMGHNTETAIRSGIVLGLVSEIDGYIERIKEKYGSVKVFMTGGDASFLSKRIKNCIFEDENLLAKGLIRILLYNNENI